MAAKIIKVLGEDIYLKNVERIASESLSDSLDLQEIDSAIEEIIGDELTRFYDFKLRGGSGGNNLGDFYKIANPKLSYLNDLGYKLAIQRY